MRRVVRSMLGRSRRGAMLLSLGTVGSGVLAYAFNVLAARALGPDLYGPVAILWASVFLVSVVLFRPIEQTLSRAIADRVARGEDVRPVIRSAGRAAMVLCVLVLGACAALWGPLTDRLFDGRAELTAALMAGIAGYALSYVARGLMGGTRWFGGYGLLLLVDGIVRVLLALPLLVVASPAIAGAAIAGAAVGGALAPLARHGARRLRSLRGGRASHTEPGRPFTARDVRRFAGPVMVMAAADQILVSGGPLLVVLAGGSTKEAGMVFAATMLVRAPVFLFQGFAAALLPSLTTFRANGDRERFRSAVARTAGALAGFAAVMTLGALALGPALMGALYGPGFGAARIDLAILSAGVGCYLAASTFSQAALAQGATARAAAAWSASAATFVVLELALSGSALTRVSIAFAVAAALNAALCIVLVVRPERHAAKATNVRPTPKLAKS